MGEKYQELSSFAGTIIHFFKKEMFYRDVVECKHMCIYRFIQY